MEKQYYEILSYHGKLLIKRKKLTSNISKNMDESQMHYTNRNWIKETKYYVIPFI
jgi:hypothetical protein